MAPTQGYHIHECGFHKPWLDEVVGDTNPLLAGMPPQVVCYHFLYQLRAFANAGFHAVIVVSGHAGGSQKDLRRVAKALEHFLIDLNRKYHRDSFAFASHDFRLRHLRFHDLVIPQSGLHVNLRSSLDELLGFLLHAFFNGFVLGEALGSGVLADVL